MYLLKAQGGKVGSLRAYILEGNATLVLRNNATHDRDFIWSCHYTRVTSTASTLGLLLFYPTILVSIPSSLGTRNKKINDDSMPKNFILAFALYLSLT